MLYLQYRVLSQYTHSSLLAAASTSILDIEDIRNEEVLPTSARLYVIRNACTSVGFVFDFCMPGLEWEGYEEEPALNLQMMGITVRIAELTYSAAPGSA